MWHKFDPDLNPKYDEKQQAEIELLAEMELEHDLIYAAETKPPDDNVLIGDVPGIGDSLAELLDKNKINTVGKAREAGQDGLVKIDGVGIKRAQSILEMCQKPITAGSEKRILCSISYPFGCIIKHKNSVTGKPVTTMDGSVRLDSLKQKIDDRRYHTPNDTGGTECKIVYRENDQVKDCSVAEWVKWSGYVKGSGPLEPVDVRPDTTPTTMTAEGATQVEMIRKKLAAKQTENK